MTPELQLALERLAQLEARLNKVELTDGHTFSKSVFRHMGNALGFFSAQPVSQQGSPNGKQDTSGSSGVAMTTGHRFNGNSGTTYYSVGDIVYALKQYGLLN